MLEVQSVLSLYHKGDNMRNTIIGFVVGAVVGATVSYFVTRKVERKNADDQIAAVTSKMNELKKDNDILKDVRKKSDANLEKPYDEIAKSPAANNDIDYNAISNSKKVVKEVKPIVEDERIKEIQEAEYYNCIKNKKYEESAFTFYQGDGVLVNEESGMRVSHPERYVGLHGVDAMKKINVEEIYFADTIDEIVNCITISNDSYYDEEYPEEDE